MQSTPEHLILQGNFNVLTTFWNTLVLAQSYDSFYIMVVFDKLLKKALKTLHVLDECLSSSVKGQGVDSS